MQYRKMGRLNWDVSEIGYGMWQAGGPKGGWVDTDDAETAGSLQTSVDLGCNFFDSAWAYGAGHSEKLLGNLVRANSSKRLYTASKIPPKNRLWPPRKGSALQEVFPPGYVTEYTEITLKNLGLESLDLQQMHVWEDDWSQHDELWDELNALKQAGKINAIGISVNRWEPDNVLKAIDTGQLDSIQVIYNIFDQVPEDVLLPYCQQHNIAVIARVPFDESTLTGKLTLDSTWQEGDWRNLYFGSENLRVSVEHGDALKPVVPEGWSMPEMALRFILHHPAVSTVIPGMRRKNHVQQNMAVSDGKAFDAQLLQQLRQHRWDRTPTSWSS